MFTELVVSFFSLISPAPNQSRFDEIDFFNRMNNEQQYNCMWHACRGGEVERLELYLTYARVDLDKQKAEELYTIKNYHKAESAKKSLGQVLNTHVNHKIKTELLIQDDKDQ